jgi:hypothetical protein
LKSNDIFDQMVRESINNEVLVLPPNLDNKINYTLNQLPIRKNVYGRIEKTKVAIVACVAFLMFVVGISYVNPTLAAQIPVLNPIVQMLGFRGDYAEYSNIVNKTVTHNGKSFTINSVVCYDNILIIGYTAKSNTKMHSTGPLFFPTYKVNGKWLNVGSAGGGQNLDDNTAIGTIEIMSDTMILPDKFKFEMSFNAIDNTSGNWDFKFNISNAELSKDTKIYTPNQVVKYGNYDFIIDKFALTPLSTVIVRHSSSQSKMPFFPIILDDQGNEISKGGGNGKESSERFDITSILSRINKDAKYLTIVPYAENSNNEPNVVSVPLNTKLPVELSQGKIGKITLDKISFSNDNDQVSIQGIIYGKLPDFREMGLSIVGDNPKADLKVLSTTIKKIGTDKYQITREISGLKNDKNYKITAPNLDNTLDYDSRITVMLK